MVTLMGCGYAMGSASGGLLASHLVPAFGWQAQFFAAASMTFVMGVVLAIWPPESIRLLTVQGRSKLLQTNLSYHELTTSELALRHSRSIGENFQAFVARNAAAEAAPPKEPAVPLWQCLTALKIPLLLFFGRYDRANAAERATLLKQKYPELDLHIVDDCKHLVPWDAADDFIRLAGPFLKS